MYSDTGLLIKSELNNRFHRNSFTRFSRNDLLRKKNWKKKLSLWAAARKKEEKKEKRKGIDVIIERNWGRRNRKVCEPLGLPFSRLPNIRQFLTIFLIIAPNSWQIYNKAVKKTRNGILLPKLFWPTVRKNCSWNFWIFFEITRTICWNSESSEQFLETECFFNLFLEVSHI